MNPKNYILIVAGEPNSIFLEIFFKTIDEMKVKKPLVIIASHKLLQLQMKKLGFKKKIKLINSDLSLNNKLDNKSINLINVNYVSNKAFESEGYQWIDDLSWPVKSHAERNLFINHSTCFHSRIQTLLDHLRKFRYEAKVMPFCFLKHIHDTAKYLQTVLYSTRDVLPDQSIV